MIFQKAATQDRHLQKMKEGRKALLVAASETAELARDITITLKEKMIRPEPEIPDHLL